MLHCGLELEQPGNMWGACMMLFLASHISPVLGARYLQHIDTNWTWLTADNLLTDSWSVRLAPYYFLAVVALAVHGGCALRWVLAEHDQNMAADRAFLTAVTAGALATLVMIVALVPGWLPGARGS